MGRRETWLGATGVPTAPVVKMAGRLADECTLTVHTPVVPRCAGDGPGRCAVDVRVDRAGVQAVRELRCEEQPEASGVR